MNVKQMLELGAHCGLQTVREAYINAIIHYDTFLTIDNYDKEMKQIHDELKKHGLLVKDDEGYFVFPEMSIKDALEKIND